MSILIIRQHARYGVCREAQLARPERRTVGGLLIELSLQGCRLGNIDERRFSLDETVTLKIPDFDDFEGQVRWVGNGVIGLRFRSPLRAPALERLIRACRGETGRDDGPAHAYA